MADASDPGSAKSGCTENPEELLVLDEELLLARLGALQLGETLGVRPSDFGRFLRVGRLWLDSNLDELRRSICDNTKVVALRNRLDSDVATEMATISDILLSLYGQAPATIVAVIVVKRDCPLSAGRSRSPDPADNTLVTALRARDWAVGYGRLVGGGTGRCPFTGPVELGRCAGFDLGRPRRRVGLILGL